MKRHALGALCAAIAIAACACGLAKGGLLAEYDAGDDTATAEGGDRATVDATEDEAASPENDDDASDAPPTEAATVDAGRGGHADAHADAHPSTASDASDSAADADADASGATDATGAPDMQADVDAEASVDDALVDGQADGTADSADAPDDVTLEPILWDGGMLADPQFTEADWVQLCATLTGCGQMPSLSECVALLKQPSSPDALIPPPAMIAVIENASPDCVAVEDALGDGTPCASTTADACMGNALVTCRWGFQVTVDCGSIGMVCSGGANPGCGFGACSAAQEGRTYCVGATYVAKCVAGRFVPTIDCATFGGTCLGPDGSASCQGTAGSPCVDGPATCSGGLILACMNGLLGAVDCTKAYDPAFTCFDDNSGMPICAAGNSCDPSTWLDACTPAGGVSFCNAGAPAEYDCPGNAWSGCAAGKCTR